MGNRPVNFNDPTGHVMDDGDNGGCYSCTQLPDPTPDPDDDDDDDPTSIEEDIVSSVGGSKPVYSPLYGDPPPPICVGPRWGNGECVDIVQLIDDAFTSIGLDSVAEVLTGELAVGWDPSLVTWEEVGMDALGLIGDLVPVAELPVTYAEGAKAFSWSITGVEAYTDGWSIVQGNPDKVNLLLNSVSVVPWLGAPASGVGLVWNLSKGFHTY